MSTTVAAPACPKCGHTRTATDVAPEWQCPACGIAYRGYRAYLGRAQERARQIVTPPHAGDAPPGWMANGSVWSLIAANLVTLGFALHQG
ncbi:MAG: hypothetical protein HY560_06415, partial [Gemmatimonadetes bacterium]|nr:hypothetical protein [Gemmatimonadota bacterium]